MLRRPQPPTWTTVLTKNPTLKRYFLTEFGFLRIFHELWDYVQLQVRGWLRPKSAQRWNTQSDGNEDKGGPEALPGRRCELEVVEG